MDDRANRLRRRIALYRRYLREGLSVEQAMLYLNQLRADEAELRSLSGEAPVGEPKQAEA